jgi:hypothetical protein
MLPPINRKRGLMFIHIPKNAGSSIIHHSMKSSPEWTIESSGGDETWHNKSDFWLAQPGLAELTPVAILRNPWARALSVYLYCLEQSSQDISNQSWIHQQLIRQGFKGAWMPGGYFVNGHGRSIEYNAETGRAWAQDDTQASWLHPKAKFFRLEDQLQEACAFMGIECPSRGNVTQHAHYRDYYDDELRYHIATLFADDIKLGGYTF